MRQKNFNAQNYSLKVFLKHIFQEVTNFDTKIFRSFIPLLFKPGFMTAEYLSGRQARYIKPITLFILINLLFFMSVYRMGYFNWSYETMANSGIHASLAQELIETKIQTENISLEEYKTQFAISFQRNQQAMFFFIIPLYALILEILYFGSKRYFVEHLIYSIHFHSFFLIVISLGIPFFLYSSIFF